MRVNWRCSPALLGSLSFSSPQLIPGSNNRTQMCSKTPSAVEFFISVVYLFVRSKIHSKNCNDLASVPM